MKDLSASCKPCNILLSLPPLLTCLMFCNFYRKPDCDIRIQLPQVSKEHCRIDLNENKEVKTNVEHL